MQQAPSVQKAPTKTVVVAGGVVVDRHIFQGRPTSPRCTTRQGTWIQQEDHRKDRHLGRGY